MSRFKISRRQLLGAAAATTVAGLAAARGDSQPEQTLAGRSVTAGADAERSDAIDARPRLALLDGMLSSSELALARSALESLQPNEPTRAHSSLASLQPRALELDLLWQWRRELAKELTRGSRAVAITRWDKALILSGLAREAALPVRQRRIGRSLFQTEIG